jgi:hypothetical protein
MLQSERTGRLTRTERACTESHVLEAGRLRKAGPKGMMMQRGCLMRERLLRGAQQGGCTTRLHRENRPFTETRYIDRLTRLWAWK